jgi:hypothetical protein
MFLHEIFSWNLTIAKIKFPKIILLFLENVFEVFKQIGSLMTNPNNKMI